MKCYIISAGLLLDYLQTSLFIPLYQTAVGIISPLKLDKEASNFQYKLWENHDLTVHPVLTDIYFCEPWYAFWLSYISNHHPVMDQKLN
jgi:hypothetical protein